MALPSSLIGTSFFANQISNGSVSGSGPFTYTEGSLLSNAKIFGTPVGSSATATVTSLTTDPSTGVQTISVVIQNSPNSFANGQTITGTVTGNDATDFLVHGTLFGGTADLYATNTAAQQPGVGASALVQAPSANVAYTPACYCAGTLIRTEHGERLVEALQIGDTIVTTSGALAEIRWIGVRAYHGRFAAGRSYLLPIRFRAGALADNVPRRDLLVSPKHAMLIDGVLVPAELLVNGSTILREHGMARVEYVHIELDHHDTIWAEGAASETFVDDGSRGIFHNADTFADLYPGCVPEAQYCRPRVEDGFELHAIRCTLNARAAGLARVA